MGELVGVRVDTPIGVGVFVEGGGGGPDGVDVDAPAGSTPARINGI